MIEISKLDFLNNIIAQSDDEDYSESGWVCWKYQDKYYLARYSHCSCYGTYEALSEQDSGYSVFDDAFISNLNYSWHGTREELLDLVKNKRDPDMIEREANLDDYDYDHLMDVYDQIINGNI